MGNEYHKRSSIFTKGNSSCLWRFISIFETSNARKLPHGRKHGKASDPGCIYSKNNLSEPIFWSTQVHNKMVADGHTLANFHSTSIKDLIEVELSKDNASNNQGCDLMTNHERNKNLKDNLEAQIEDLMLYAHSVSERTKCGDTVEVSNLIKNLAALMIEFDRTSRQHPDKCAVHKIDLCTSLKSICCKKHSSHGESDSQLTQSVLEEALNVKADALLDPKVDDSTGHGDIQSQEYMNTVEILSSNKELLSKLVQDPNLFVFGLVQELQKLQAAVVSTVEKCSCLEGRDQLAQNNENSGEIEKSTGSQILLNQKLHFFSKKNKDVPKIRNNSKPSSTTISLAPCTSTTSWRSKEHEKENERFFSHFSFREIKRRLRDIIRDDKKEQHLNSRGDVLQRVPYWYEASRDTMRMHTRDSTVNASTAVGKADKKAKTKVCQHKLEAEFTQDRRQGILPTFPFDKEFYYEETRKNHFEMLGNTSESRENELRESPVLGFSEKMLHLRELEQISATLSPDGVKERNSAPKKVVSSPMSIDSTVHLSPLKDFKETTGISIDIDLETPVTGLEEADKHVNLNKHLRKGRKEIVEIKSANSADTNPAADYMVSNIIAASVDSEHGSYCESWREEECWKVHEPGIYYEKGRIQIPSTTTRASSLSVKNFDPTELFVNKPDQPSPVSVFEPFFLDDDDASPEHASTKCNSFTASEESTTSELIYVASQDEPAVIVATSDHTSLNGRTCLFDREAITKYVRGVLMDLDSERRTSSKQLLPPSLLYDGVKEAILEIKDEQSQFSPWVSFLKPAAARPILEEEEDVMIDIVCRNMEKNLGSQTQSTLKLNEIMGRDMSRAKWMELRLEMEYIIAEMGMLIFEEMMEEIILES